MNRSKDEFFMKEALEEAKKAYKKGEVPIGAVIVKDNKIIARGHNLVESKKSSLAHAEIIAIDKANKRLGGWRLINSTMYVTLEPCAMCAGAIINSRIDRVVISARDKKRGCCGSNYNLLNTSFLNHRCKVETGLMEEHSVKIIKSFFKKLREKHLR